MRWALVLVTAIAVGACASIVGLDASDPEEQPEVTGTTASSSGAGPGVTSSSSSTGGSSSSSSGQLDSGVDATKPVPTEQTCDKPMDCKNEDDAHLCGNDGKCTSFCLQENDRCFGDDTCCFGLDCKFLGVSEGFRCKK